VFTLDQHLARLDRSLGEIRLRNPHSDAEWRQLFTDAIGKSGLEIAYLYLQVTRGVAAERSHVYPDVAPTVLVTVTPAPLLTRESVNPYRMVTKQDFRWGRGDIKVISLIANGLLKNEALDEGYDDAILIRDGKVTEATAANVFIAEDGVIVTPPKSNFLLHGITRDHVVKLALENNLSLEEREISEAEVLGADEVWITSTGHEVWPVTEVNNQQIGNGEPGMVYGQLDQLFQASKAAT